MSRITRRVFSSRMVIGAVAALAATAHGGHRPAIADHGPQDGRDDDRGASAGTAGPTDHLVEIDGFAFQPAGLDVRPGDTVTWVNRDIAPHTATADDGSWDTGTIRTDQRVSLPVTRDMAPTYHCRFHPTMTARLAMGLDR